MSDPIDLTTRDAVKAWLGITNNTSDNLIDSLITRASQFILNVLNANPLTVSAYDEWYDAGVQPWVVLRQLKPVNITSVQFGSTVLTQQAAGVPPSNGFLLMPEGNWARLHVYGYCWPVGRSVVRVQYTAGFSAVPDDLEQACIELIGEKFKKKDRIGVVSKSLPNGETVTFAKSDFTPDVKSAIQNYIRVTS